MTHLAYVTASEKRYAIFLIGSPEAIRQTMHLLHVLNYAESLLWSPITTVGDNLMITREQGEAMSLLRRPV